MKLYYSHASPYARKCRMAIAVCQLAGQVELQLTDPLNNQDFRQINPLGKVPALAAKDLTLFDSALICEYIAEQSQVDLFRRGHNDYFSIQLNHAQANGLLDAAVATVMERRRETEHSLYWLDRWQRATIGAIETFDISALGDQTNVHIGTIATVAALEYLDFRLPEWNWRQYNAALADWQHTFDECAWVKSTAPR